MFELFNKTAIICPDTCLTLPEPDQASSQPTPGPATIRLLGTASSPCTLPVCAPATCPAGPACGMMRCRGWRSDLQFLILRKVCDYYFFINM